MHHPLELVYGLRQRAALCFLRFKRIGEDRLRLAKTLRFLGFGLVSVPIAIA